MPPTRPRTGTRSSFRTPRPRSTTGRTTALRRRPVANSAITLPGPRPLPAGLPREWYVRHNRQIKAMRIAIALLNSGIYTRQQAGDPLIRVTAEAIGVHPPSATTCHLVRTLLPDARGLAA
ncbi:hypothetical protein BIV57_10375 [Mangrovactinospora gilvigrisea]|uniref:Uncharacterized protein n=1 Tax=Mangrovactinospora gilvigrisea TaxID=1428644 RepID=A0A1J7BFR5_9ACTN|nr:hypothetical protein [Mangrovactinospora gilvigrisea]OIV37523.1 hypothetical protein BIV57_10375 [Mangrovactinospora gilvigrisea]